MSSRVVYVVCAEGEEALADRIADPLQKAGYEVAHNGTIAIGDSLLGEAEKAIASGSPIVLCATAKAIGSRWSYRIINAAHQGVSRVFMIQMEREAYVEQLSLGGKVARYCDDPAQAIRELLEALDRYFPSAQENEEVQSGITDVTEPQFLDQLTGIAAFDIEAFERFRSEFRDEVSRRYPRTITAWEFLSQESLWIKGRLTRTGALLFASNPTAACPTSMVKCTRYNGNDRAATRDMETFVGTVPVQIVSAHHFVADRVRVGEAPSAGQAQLIAVYDYPMVAVREIIANALVHRDYAIADSCVHVRLFNDRLEVSSPGSWVGRSLDLACQYELSVLNGQSRKRNYRLAHMLSFISLVEGEGSGIPAALSSCEAIQSPVPMVVQEDGFVTVIIRRREHRDGMDNVLSFAEQLKSLRQGAALTHKALARSSGVSERSISDLERALIHNPRPGTVRRLADALGLDGPIRASFEATAQRGAQYKIVSADRNSARPRGHRPWSKTQVRVADSWPDRRGHPVSLALSPTADRVAMSVGQRLTVATISGRALGKPLYRMACALAPGLAWSSAGDKLAFRDNDGRCRVLDLAGQVPVVDGEVQTQMLGVTSAMAFSPEGEGLATLAPSLPGRMTLSLRRPGGEVLWESTLTRPRTSSYRSEGVNLAWSPDGRFLACTTGTSSTASTVWLIDAADGHSVGQFDNHSDTVTGLAWIDDDWVLSASEDATLQVWRPDGSAPATVIETIPAAGMIFVREQGTALIWSGDGELFAWSLADGPAQLWYRNPPSPSVVAHFTRLAVSAVNGLLALADAGATHLTLISDWHRTAHAPTATTTYANAKVLLLGDSGVGKSALAMVLADEEFRATESTHGRLIWRLPATEEAATSGGEREVLLWDPAGQPGYRIVHQLHLGGAAVALILFDSRSETTPLAGVQHWARAIRHAHPDPASGPVTFLVAARTDRGGITVSPERIHQVIEHFALDAYFETSAKEEANTDLLRSRVLAAIDWERIPKVASTALFAGVKQFIVDQKSSGNLLTPLDELSRTFQVAMPGSLELLRAELQLPDLDDAEAEEAHAAALNLVFAGCVARLESADLVKRLKYWDYVLLQPDLLDGYAAAIVNAARDEPDGLGCILESKVIELDFAIPSTARVLVERQERLLVIATLEELIQAELVLRENTEDGVQLVFPAAFRRDLPASEAPEGDGVVFRFEGPVDNVYATLIVRLARSNRFTRVATWQSAARFAADAGQCTVFLKSDGEGKAELRIGYDGVPGLIRMQFEWFVHAHLDRWAIRGSVVRERRYSCPDDNTAFTPEQVEQVRARGRESIVCPVCEKRVSLRDDYELTTSADHSIAAMDASADVGRQKAAASTVLRGKEEVAGFDVFLCHNAEDKPAVHKLAQRLRERGLRPWLDEVELKPGVPWQQALEEQIQSIPAAVVIVGSRVGPWQDQELAEFLRQFVERRCPVIPVLLPGAERPDLPVLLDGMTWVDLAASDPDPLDQLEWGITGRHPDR
jgi:GTPase SAR1 family protein/transcriptional regulator with XRE-family HTH domain/nucleotide-binding universal stress UspA family protein